MSHIDGFAQDWNMSIANLCNSVEDGAPVDEIYGGSIFKWVLEVSNGDTAYLL